MFRVTVGFETNILNFVFRELADAVSFIQEVIETAENTGTSVSIVEVE